MPESKKRKRPEGSRPTSSAAAARPVKKKGPSPRWLAPLMLTLFGIGVLWLVVFYITQGGMGGLPVASDLGQLEPARRLRLHHRRLRPVDAVALTGD